MGKQEDIDALIVRHLTGDLSADEESLFEALLSSDESFAEAYRATEAAWDAASDAALVGAVEARKSDAWRSVEQQTVGRRRVGLRGWAMRVAAVVVPLIAFAALSVTAFRGERALEYAAAGAADTISLPDGSDVILYEGSSLRYYADAKGRHAELDGMARFHVTHDASNPFSVNASDAQVRVLGTTFTVENWAEQSRVRTTVTEGRVAMSAGKSIVLMTAGEGAEWSHGKLVKSASGQGRTDLARKSIEFNGANLEQVVSELLTCYHETLRGVAYECGSDSSLVTTSFEAQPLEEVLGELSMHFDKKFSVRNGYLTISD